jgi:hypothetical protein
MHISELGQVVSSRSRSKVDVVSGQNCTFASVAGKPTYELSPLADSVIDHRSGSAFDPFAQVVIHVGLIIQAFSTTRCSKLFQVVPAMLFCPVTFAGVP